MFLHIKAAGDIPEEMKKWIKSNEPEFVRLHNEHLAHVEEINAQLPDQRSDEYYHFED